MSYLVDTDVFSEPRQKHPSTQVVAWLRECEPELRVSMVTLGEILRGIYNLPPGNRR